MERLKSRFAFIRYILAPFLSSRPNPSLLCSSQDAGVVKGEGLPPTRERKTSSAWAMRDETTGRFYYTLPTGRTTPRRFSARNLSAFGGIAAIFSGRSADRRRILGLRRSLCRRSFSSHVGYSRRKIGFARNGVWESWRRNWRSIGVCTLTIHFAFYCTENKVWSSGWKKERLVE